MLESRIQRGIVKKLRAWGWIVLKLQLTGQNGYPDLVALRNGKAVFIEVKAPGKRPTPLQEYRHGQLREQGFRVEVVDNIHELKGIVNN